MGISPTVQIEYMNSDRFVRQFLRSDREWCREGMVWSISLHVIEITEPMQGLPGDRALFKALWGQLCPASWF